MTDHAWRGRFWLPLFFFTALGIVLHFNHGFYSDGGLAVILLGWIGAVTSGILGATFEMAGVRSQAAKSNQRIELALWGILILFSCTALRGDLLNVADTRRAACFAGCIALGVLGSCVALISPRLREHASKTERVQIVLCVFVAGLLLAAQVLTLMDSRNPGIDVYSISTAAADYLRRGINPYSQVYPDLYHGAYGYAPTFNYWPGALLPEALCRWFFGDIRAAFIVANVITAAALNSIARSVGWPKRLAALASVLWLSFPVELFVLDQAWVDTLLIAFAALFVVFAVRGKWIRAGIALGLFCATKQYAVFFAALSLLMVFAPRAAEGIGGKPLLKTAIASLVVFLALLLPFAAWDIHAFFANTIEKFLRMPPRSDALSFVGAILHMTGKALPGGLCAGVYLVALAASSLLLLKNSRSAPETMRAWSAGLVLTYGATFLFGKEAFCNYYFLLAFFVLIQTILSTGTPEATAC